MELLRITTAECDTKESLHAARRRHPQVDLLYLDYLRYSALSWGLTLPTTAWSHAWSRFRRRLKRRRLEEERRGLPGRCLLNLVACVDSGAWFDVVARWLCPSHTAAAFKFLFTHKLPRLNIPDNSAPLDRRQMSITQTRQGWHTEEFTKKSCTAC